MKRLPERSKAVDHGTRSTQILVSDLAGAYGLAERVVAELADDLNAYGIGWFDQMDGEFGPKGAVTIGHLPSGFPLWLDVVSFCGKTATSLEVFTEELDF